MKLRATELATRSCGTAWVGVDGPGGRMRVAPSTFRTPASSPPLPPRPLHLHPAKRLACRNERREAQSTAFFPHLFSPGSPTRPTWHE
eukprot:330502-Chlamydomonas_euryale.AAC.2